VAHLQVVMRNFAFFAGSRLVVISPRAEKHGGLYLITGWCLVLFYAWQKRKSESHTRGDRHKV